MAKRFTDRIWAAIARRVLRHGGAQIEKDYTTKASFRKLSRSVERLHGKLFGRTLQELGDGDGVKQPFDENAVLKSVLELRDKDRREEAEILLLRHSEDFSCREEVLMIQAWLAYEQSYDADAVSFIEAAIDATSPQRTTLFWGPVAIISNSYWSRAMNEAGWPSKTLMHGVAHINRREDFDFLVKDVMPSWLCFEDPQKIFSYGLLPHLMAFLHLIRHASVVHIPATGSFLGHYRLWNREAGFFRRAGIKTVLLPFGGDYYCYSYVQDPCVRHGLLANYPDLARNESGTKARLTYWQESADAVLSGFMVDAMGRWDVTTFCFFHIDSGLWQPKRSYSQADGRNGAVRVIHTPNHRGFKGTEFLLDSVEKLKAEGLKLELTLLERLPNSEVRRLMGESDILAEQFIATAYAMSGIEGMATGIPVMANLDSEYYTGVYRRCSFLNECPILSTSPETLTDNLRLLVTRPDLREALGRAGRLYVDKYHSLDAAKFLFGKIHDRILRNQDVDLINLYHPILSEHARQHPKVGHPLVESRLPQDSSFRK